VAACVYALKLAVFSCVRCYCPKIACCILQVARRDPVDIHVRCVLPGLLLAAGMSLLSHTSSRCLVTGMSSLAAALLLCYW
jgi:hypothetical protein